MNMIKLNRAQKSLFFEEIIYISLILLFIFFYYELLNVIKWQRAFKYIWKYIVFRYSGRNAVKLQLIIRV